MRVPSGFYPLSLAGDGGVGVGDLNLRASVSIVATGDTGVFIDASALGQRAFTLGSASGGRRYVLEGLTVFGARDASIDGGAIAVDERRRAAARLDDRRGVGRRRRRCLGGRRRVVDRRAEPVPRELGGGHRRRDPQRGHPAARGEHDLAERRRHRRRRHLGERRHHGDRFHRSPGTRPPARAAASRCTARPRCRSSRSPGTRRLAGAACMRPRHATVEVGDAIVSDNEAERRPDCAGRSRSPPAATSAGRAAARSTERPT